MINGRFWNYQAEDSAIFQYFSQIVNPNAKFEKKSPIGFQDVELFKSQTWNTLIAKLRFSTPHAV